MRSLFDGGDISGISQLTMEKLAFALVGAGGPHLCDEGTSALRHARNYVNAVVNTGIFEVDGVEKDPNEAYNLMVALAWNTSATAKLKTILDNVSGEDRDDINSDKAVSSYLNVLRCLFVIENPPAWNPDMRSKTALRTSPKHHFVDSSIAASISSRHKNILDRMGTRNSVTSPARFAYTPSKPPRSIIQFIK